MINRKSGISLIDLEKADKRLRIPFSGEIREMVPSFLLFSQLPHPIDFKILFREIDKLSMYS